MKYYEYCPMCNHKEMKEEKKTPKVMKFGTDGWGQPVSFTNCECGKLKGYLIIDWYLNKDVEIDDGFLAYLRHRIDHYSEVFNK